MTILPGITYSTRRNPQVGEVITLPPTSGPTFEGNESFSTTSPTWWDGTAITGDAKDYYDGIVWWANSTNWDEHQGLNTSTDGGLDDIAGLDDLYALARYLRDRLQVLTGMLALTGDLRFLDTVVDVLDITKNQLAIGYRGHDTGTVTWDASPYRCWITTGGGQPANLYGTDLSTMNEVKWHATLAECTYALKVNIGKTSPTGKNYSDEYDFWIDYLTNDFIPKWSGGGTSSWRAKYTGVRRDPNYSSPARADADAWPVVVNGGEMHSSVSSTHLAYYMSKLLTGTAAANALDEFEWMTNAFLTTDCELIDGTHLVWPHTSQAQGSSAHYAQTSIYVGYTAADFTMARILDFDPDVIDDALLTQMGNAVNDYYLTGNYTGLDSISERGATEGDLAGGVIRGGFTSENADSGITMGQVTFFNIPVLARWSGTNTSDLIGHIFTLSWMGTKTQPATPFANFAALLVDAPLSGD